MWGIDNPLKVYDYLDINYNSRANFQLITICLESKYLSLSSDSRNAIESMVNSQLTINQIKIKSPNNPAKMINAKIIRYTR